MRLTILCSLLFALTVSAAAQDLTHFEVAAIRPVVIPANSSGGVPVFFTEGGIGSSNPTRIKYKAIWLDTLIRDAFGLKNFQLSQPAWVRDERYDIEASIPAGATRAQFNVMLQNLLKERFNLGFHYESKMIPVYAVVIGKNGAKLKESSMDPAAKIAEGTTIGSADEKGYPTLPPGFSGVVGRPGKGSILIAAQRASLDEILSWPGGSLDRPIVNETGLTGKYDVKMEYESKGKPGAQSGDAPDPVPTAASALEKLGLKLEPEQRPFDVLIIDRLDKVPTGN